MAEPERRRRRPAVSCSLCRRRKIRCNRETPCSNCTRSKNESCVYENHLPQPPRQQHGQGQTAEPSLAPKPRESLIIDSASRGSTVASHPSSSLVATSTHVSASQPSARDVECMVNRIRQLEEQLSKATLTSIRSPASTPNSSTETTTSSIGNVHVHLDPQAITRSVTHKTRLLGQSHWMNGFFFQFRDVYMIIEPLLRGLTSKPFSPLLRCKSLARMIKSQRAPPWPSPPTADLPPKSVVDELVDCYLRTTETVYRILHVPTFRRNYDALWVSDAEPDMEFLVQLKLVLAVGAATYDEQFSLRASAVRWVYEAHTWLAQPIFKPRLSIQILQTSLLLLLAQESADVGGEFIWISAGALFRRAVSMGLHRDPARLPKMTTFAAEMRRRLWNTILEVTLQSSLSSGGPPLLTRDDFDTEPPGNFDDDQLVAEDPVPKPEADFTQTSVAIALRKTFPLRLAVAKFLNDLGSHGSYEETLRLDAELRASYKTLRQTLQACSSSTGPSPSLFQIRVVDFITHRYLSSLHVPFFSPSLEGTIAYAFSRKVVVDCSLKIWRAACPSSSVATAAAATHRDDFARLVACGSGFYRTVAIQASLLVSVELTTQLRDEENLSLGPVPPRPDLLSVLVDAKAWCLRCIEAGETNIKGYLGLCVVVAEVDGLMRGLGKDEIPPLLLKAAEDAESVCLPILERMAAQGRAGEPAEAPADGLHHGPLNTPPELMEDWDFMMSDALLNSGNAEPMTWMLNDETLQGPSLW